MTHRAHAVLAAAAAASLLLPACSGRVPHDEEVIRDRAADFDRLTSSRDFSVRKSSLGRERPGAHAAGDHEEPRLLF